MALKLIVGPPNSGRSGEVMRALKARAADEPLLIVPTRDDIARFERDLCTEGLPAIGATISTFGAVFSDIATTAAIASPPRLSPPQRLALVRVAIRSTDLRILRRSSASPGFAPALDSLIAEFQAALVTPASLRASAEAAGDADLELELAALHEAYESLRDGAGMADAGSIAQMAAKALRDDPEIWSGRPVFMYGFDDLTESQLELVLTLAGRTEIALAVNYADREALAARAGLLARLREADAEEGAHLELQRGYTSSATLAHLSASLFEVAPGTVPPDGGVKLIEAGGERGEAEAAGIEIARLITAGADPGEIVVVLRNPSAEGPLFASVLRGLDIPLTLEAQLPLDVTAVGRALLALCRAADRDGEPADVLAHLRADTGSHPGKADWAERAIARGDAESVADLERRWEDSMPPHLARVREASGGVDQVRAVAAAARRIAEGVHREAAPLAGARSDGVPLDAIELRAAVTAAELLEELSAVASLPGCDAPALSEAAEAIESASVRSWLGSAEGRVRIVSPYRARAARCRHLFMCAMQEGTFPGRGTIDPLLGEESRKRLGIPALRRREQDSEERYLFHVCVSRPTDTLTLTWRSCDDEGLPAARSPFVDEVVDLLGDDAKAVEREITQKRGLIRAVPLPSEATNPRTLARALTATAGRDLEAQRAMLDGAGIDLAVAGDSLAITAASNDPAWRPGPLTHPAVLGAIAERESLSANSLENWIECSYRWFVSHELSPQRLEPLADPLWLGSLVHASLHDLYAEPPGEDTIPRAGDVDRWIARFNEILDAFLGEADSGYKGADRRLSVARTRLQVEKYLEEEAERETDLRPHPDLLERSFGFPDNEGDPGALQLGDFTLRGAIDRIDVAPDSRRAVVRDYKTSKRVAGRAKIEKEKKLQLPLYMLVARDLLKLDPIAGLYHPLAAYGDRRGRGIALRDEVKEGVLSGEPLVAARKSDDAVEAEAFEEALERARTDAVEYGAKMRAGAITRNPLENKCPTWCEYQPICRRERALGIEDEAQGSDDS
jgi:ATP-dependent helicase/DNAse subunit B